MTLSRFAGAVALALAGLVFTAPSASATQFVVDGGFEGTNAAWIHSGTAGIDSYWFYADNGLTGDPVHGGNSALYMGASSASDLDLDVFTQTIASLTTNAFYQLTFWLKNDFDPVLFPADNYFEVKWDGASLVGVGATLSDAAAFNFTQYTFTVQATAATANLSFGSRNPPGFYILDDVSLTEAPVEQMPVPEPASLLLLGTGLAFGARRIRKRNAAAKSA